MNRTYVNEIMEKTGSSGENPASGKVFVFEKSDFSQITYALILQHSAVQIPSDPRGRTDITILSADINTVQFSFCLNGEEAQTVIVIYENENLVLNCSCNSADKRMCIHQTAVLSSLVSREDYKIFFDRNLRYNKLKNFAKDFGLEDQTDLDCYFIVESAGKGVEMKPRLKELQPVNREQKEFLKAKLFPNSKTEPGNSVKNSDLKVTRFIILSRHRFYKNLIIEIGEAQTTREGKIRNPVGTVNPLDQIWKLENIEEVKFYTAVSRFQKNYETEGVVSELEALNAIIKNPNNWNFFLHDSEISTSITSSSLRQIVIKLLKADLYLNVYLRDEFYSIIAELKILDRFYNLNDITLRFDYFILAEGVYYFSSDPQVFRVIEYFRQAGQSVLIHQSKFEEFRMEILSELENNITINYSYLKPATRKQLEENGFDTPPEKLIYLTDSQHYVLITPVIKYGQTEISVLSKKQIYATDAQGNSFLVARNDYEENQFIASLLKQSPEFEEQLDRNNLFVTRNKFLDEDWFLNAFEEWRSADIKILGFNELRNNRLNPYKAKIQVRVSSGTDWFNSEIDIRYGEHALSIRNLYKAIRNKSRYVELGDGTTGILPQEWIEKFSAYFNAGFISDHLIRTPVISFSDVERLYESSMLDDNVKHKITGYKKKLSSFTQIEQVVVPEGLKTELRNYQKQGLNWLSFLDEFNFGGCLADDMGLGKTVQIIAFLLLQKQKYPDVSNLVIVPATLVFNWKEEINKFAPDLKLKILHGADRDTGNVILENTDIVLTTYGTLLSDIVFLKDYKFNYIILDESQNIKNPDAQRYKAVMLLKSRNRIVMTGTPMENNTYDLFAQLSFACPGLLGSRQFFRDHYAVPVDRFGDKKRADELSSKIKPFILRRTKEQVVDELPEKTEITLYCEMGSEQRAVYDGFEKEIRDFLEGQAEDEIRKQSLHVLRALTKLRQICNSPAILNEENFYGSDSSKINVLMEEIENKSPDHKILVFSQFVSMLDLIRKELSNRNISHRYLTGQTKNREAEVRAFQEHENNRVFLISLKAGGTGLNLTEADYVYIIDPWWNPAVENQAVDRSHRIGQKKNVVAVRLICPGTIEEKILQLQQSKEKLISDIVKTDFSVFKSLSRQELISLFK